MNRFPLRRANLLTAVAASCFLAPLAVARAADRPNVVLVITDDQGYGDIHAHGNDVISTPNLDRLHSESVRLTDFHVDPTCSPTRSALMTGRYSTRTGVWHTIMGRSLMSASEVTIAEVLRRGGYRTAMFGKWHLGDNYPCRPQDQGFDEAYYHGGGGVGQTPDYFGNDYFDDTYFRKGAPEKAAGYCTDVWFDRAIEFIAENARKDRPFFVYLSTNAPHGPYRVAEKYSRPYAEKGVPKTMAAFYGMITNIDENMGRLMAKLGALGVAENTILIFMTDNGTAAGFRGRKRREKPRAAAPRQEGWSGFNDGMRGQKGSEYDGGHRVPFFVRWPKGGLTGGRDIPQLSAHIDVLPTLAELCGAESPRGVDLDGRSLVPLLRGLRKAWPGRTLFVHSQRIEHPQKWRKSSVMTERFRLVNGRELYDIEADPGQTRNIAADRADVVGELREAYEGWWKGLSTVMDEYVAIRLGSDAENPANLTCHDWHTGGGPVPWNQRHIQGGLRANGFWAVDVERDGRYEITLRRWPEEKAGAIEATTTRLKLGDVDVTQKVSASDPAVTFRVELRKGPARLETWLTSKDGRTRGAYFVRVKRLE